MNPATAIATDDAAAYAWSLLQALARAASREQAVTARTGIQLDGSGRLRQTSEHEGFVCVRPDLAAGWSATRPLERSCERLLDLYMPLCVGPRSARLVSAHLGQSSDGHSTAPPDRPKFITGHEDIVHAHHLRALFDAVLVGAGTIAVDDPQLTTRLVPGRSPVRIVLDPHARLPEQHAVFRDRRARTLVVVATGQRTKLPSYVELLPLDCGPSGFDLHALLVRLRALGLPRLFIEGGSVTIGHFARAQLLDRLQLVVANVAFGGARDQASAELSALTPGKLAALGGRVQQRQLGNDVLHDCTLTPLHD